MAEGQVIEFFRVSKRFGAVEAVSDFSAQVTPGIVTGFLGPNGAGKTTTLRMLLGLVRPTSGVATIGGERYADLKYPLRTVGAALEASSFHPGRTAANHLKIQAQAGGIERGRIDEVLGLVGLADVAGRKVGGYSLGMRQRLGLATALLGDPGVIVLDEPANGLDPEGIRWMRTFLRQLAREGRTVLTSSHLLAEVQQTAHSLVIIAQGHLVFSGRIYELTAHDEMSVVVDSPDRAALVDALNEAHTPFEVLRAGLSIRGGDRATIGALAAHAGIALSALHKRKPSLEEVFLELVNGLRVHPSASNIAGSLEAGQHTATSSIPVIVDDDQPDDVADDSIQPEATESAEPAVDDQVDAAEEDADAAPVTLSDDDLRGLAEELGFDPATGQPLPEESTPEEGDAR